MGDIYNLHKKPQPTEMGYPIEEGEASPAPVQYFFSLCLSPSLSPSLPLSLSLSLSVLLGAAAASGAPTAGRACEETSESDRPTIHPRGREEGARRVFVREEYWQRICATLYGFRVFFQVFFRSFFWL